MTENLTRPPEEQIKTNLVVEAYGGSIAYGTNTPTSDVDIRGIFWADPIHTLTPFFPMEEVADDKQDTKFFELDKFIKLYLEGNPNILELLWVDPVDVLSKTWIYDELVKHRADLLSSKVAFTYTGYAVSQLKRMKGHQKWINNPKDENPPVQVDYIKLVHNMTDRKFFKLDLRDYRQGYRLIPYDGNVYGLYQMDGYETFDDKGMLNTTYDPEEHIFTVDGGRRIPIAILKFNKEEYKRDLEEWQNYWNWKRNRNKVRAELEEKYGLDCKHLAHTIRLLRTGVEILTTGRVIVKRPDAEELLAIRNGAWSYDQAMSYAEEMDTHIREKLYHETDLPKTPNVKLAAKMLMDIKRKLYG